MATNRTILLILAVGLTPAAPAAPPKGVRAVWDLHKAYREKTPARGRVCLNGLWRWQPARGGPDAVPADKWGYFKVPGCWPGITDYMQKGCQTVHAHPSWKNQNLPGITTAWYQREITIPAEWVGRRIAVYMEYVNSYADFHADRNTNQYADVGWRFRSIIRW